MRSYKSFVNAFAYLRHAFRHEAISDYSVTIEFADKAEADFAMVLIEHQPGQHVGSDGRLKCSGIPVKITHRDEAPMIPPANCRQRLVAEGKPYPKSSCAVCGKFMPEYKTCNAILYDAKQQSDLSSPAQQHPTVSPDPNVERNRQMLLERSIVGQKKYGHTTATNPLELKDWINHALEEVLDMANYLQAAKSKLEGKQ